MDIKPIYLIKILFKYSPGLRSPDFNEDALRGALARLPGFVVLIPMILVALARCSVPLKANRQPKGVTSVPKYVKLKLSSRAAQKKAPNP